MPLDAADFLPISAQANSNAPRLHTYRTADTIAEVKANNYFNDVATPTGALRSGDVILVDASDGQSFLFVGVNPGSGSVTLASAADFA